jgi:hypothetical protein
MQLAKSRLDALDPLELLVLAVHGIRHPAKASGKGRFKQWEWTGVNMALLAVFLVDHPRR